MPMNSDENTKYGQLGGTAANLQTAIDAYNTAKNALAPAQTAFDNAKNALDTAYGNFRSSETTFESAFVLPAGYVPPV